MKVAIFVLACIGAVMSGIVKRQATTLLLPDGAEVVVGAIKGGFSCSGRIYGYYADVDNNCNIFHICVPVVDPENHIDETFQYSFFCGNQTVFDQEHLVCVHPSDLENCGAASGLYDSVNSKFGIVDRPSG